VYYFNDNVALFTALQYAGSSPLNTPMGYKTHEYMNIHSRPTLNALMGGNTHKYIHVQPPIIQTGEIACIT